MKLNFYQIGLVILLYIIVKITGLVSTQLKFKDPSKSPSWWGWYLMVIPLTWVFLQVTKVGVEGFGGNL